MLPGPVVLDLRVKLVYVVGKCDDHAFHRNIPDAGTEISAETHAVFRFTERSFCLDAPVHPELYPLIACDPFQTFFPFFYEDPLDLNALITFLKGSLAVVSFDAIFFIRAAAAVFTYIKRRLPLIAGSS